MVPNEDDKVQLKSLDSDKIDSNTLPQCNNSTSADKLTPLQKSDTFDSQAELAELDCEPEMESPKHTRYSSPLFQRLLGEPIEPVKIIRSPTTETSTKLSSPTIPEDSSIFNLLHTASLVSKTQKTPDTLELDKVDEKELTQSNHTNLELEEEKLDEQFLKNFSVAEKRPSMNDPEKVLMKDIVTGKMLIFWGNQIS